MTSYRKLCTRISTVPATPIMLALACLLVGCSKPQGPPIPELTEVTGILTVNGKPAQGVAVIFTPSDGADPSFGSTAEDGKFRLRYRGTDFGAVPGTHRVQFQLAGADANIDVLPRRYREGDSGISVDVKSPGPNEFTFDLKGK